MTRIFLSPAIKILLAGMICLAGAQVSAATAEGGPSASEAHAEDALSSLRRSLDTAQATYRRVLVTNEAPAGATGEEVLERNHLMGDLVASLQHTIEAAERLTELRERVVEQERRTREWAGFPTPPPYSILLVDQLRKALSTASFNVQAADARALLLKQQEAEGEQRYRAAEIAKRQGEERASQAVAADQRDRHLWLIDLANLRSRAAAASLEEARTWRTVTAAEEAEQQALVRLLEKQVATARQSAHFPQSDLDSVLRELDRRQGELKKQTDQARSASRRSHQALALAQQALASFKTNLPGGSATEIAFRQDILEKTEELRRLQADNDDLTTEITLRILDAHAWERSGWQLRRLLLTSGDRAKLREALSELDQLVHRLETWTAYLDSEIARAPGPEDRLVPEGVSADQSTLAAQIQAAQRARVDILRNGQQAFANLQRTLSIWRQDFQARGADRSPSAIARDAAIDLWQGLRAIWRFEIFTVEDSLEIDGRRVVATRSVTVGKSVGAILFLVLGYFVSGWTSRRLGRFSARLLGGSTGHANIAARWLQFVLLAVLGIFTLYMVNIPLTVFAFLGGALAIGLGFGTQVLLKNLVSGVMLLVERPLRVGDRIEVGGVSGWVTDIGLRSSTVRTNDGIEILVPNSTFIENNVTNWTYSSATVRRSIKVGVDYGASPERVHDLLLQVCADHPEVLAEPEPHVLFEEFGSDALIFNVQYWIDYDRVVDGARVASDLHFMIKRRLTEAGIGIPYPQRVIHFAPGSLTTAIPGSAEPPGRRSE